MIDVILNRGHFFLGVIQIPAFFRGRSNKKKAGGNSAYSGRHNG